MLLIISIWPACLPLSQAAHLLIVGPSRASCISRWNWTRVSVFRQSSNLLIIKMTHKRIASLGKISLMYC
jgi:hypothetical protein